MLYYCVYETVPGPLAMPGILIKANLSSGDTDGSKQLLARIRIPLTSAPGHPDEEIMNHPHTVQIRSYLESLPAERRSLEVSIRSTDKDCEYDAL